MWKIEIEMMMGYGEVQKAWYKKTCKITCIMKSLGQTFKSFGFCGYPISEAMGNPTHPPKR